jgi:hypothetical protein
MDKNQINGDRAYPPHPFVGISPWPRMFVYTIGTLTLSVAFMVFTESYLRFFSSTFLIALAVALGYGLAAGNLMFFIMRRLARKLFEPHPWIYAFNGVFLLPWVVWIVLKNELYPVEMVLAIGSLAIGGLLGTELAKRKAAVFRLEFLERWKAEVDRQRAENAHQKQ